MITMDKHLFYSFSEVTNYLTSIGFVISGSKILWDEAEDDTTCYLQLNNNTINLHRSDGELGFSNNLIDFSDSNRPVAAVIYIPLKDNGVALYLGMVPNSLSVGDIYPTCENGNSVLNNGLIVISPEENDGHWYYGWNASITINSSEENEENSEEEEEYNPDDYFYWCLDNGHGLYEYDENVTIIPFKKIYQTPMSLTLVRPLLRNGYWCENFKMQVTGDLEPPGAIFKINGQKYITFTNNSIYRCPAYKLPAESIEMNLSTSTEEYSNAKTYVVGDYCIYEGLLYKCIAAVLTPENFDNSKWIVTTVYNELISQSTNTFGIM